jgi:hypothetical protein
MSDALTHEDGVFVSFTLHPVACAADSEKEGRPIFRDQEYVRIVIPGDKTTDFFQPSTARHRERFPRAYALFTRGATARLDGTPIAQWPAVSRAQAAELQALNILTVEALRDLADAHLDRLGPGGAALRARARAFLDHAADAAVTQSLAAENEHLKADLADLRRQLADVSAQRHRDEETAAPARATRKGARS